MKRVDWKTLTEKQRTALLARPASLRSDALQKRVAGILKRVQREGDAALRAYAEQADADSYQRRLFADDAARGFDGVERLEGGISRGHDVLHQRDPLGWIETPVAFRYW